MWKEALLLFIYTLIVIPWGGSHILSMCKRQDLSLCSKESFKIKGFKTLQIFQVFKYDFCLNNSRLIFLWGALEKPLAFRKHFWSLKIVFFNRNQNLYLCYSIVTVEHIRKLQTYNVIVTPCSVSLAIRQRSYTKGYLTHHWKPPRFKG